MLSVLSVQLTGINALVRCTLFLCVSMLIHQL
jgi:hypothetical protein